MAKNSVKGAEESKKFTVLGTFEGECADANITNLNGLDITREVWENVFNSDEYKQAIDLGWYIGFLGHPEDPNCMDFEHACIVMTDGHIDDSGKIYGSFNLVDTPVGRIVKSFIDAGVQFGISVRGAGDIINNSVDPDTFVFRGFDLVSFPAYPESIPTFTEIAASSDAETRKKYKIMCSALNDNIDELDSCEAIEILQSQFAKQSDEYRKLEAKKESLRAQVVDKCEDGDFDLYAAQVQGMTDLYLDALQANSQLSDHVVQLKNELKRADLQHDRKIKSMRRIMNSQLSDMENKVKQNKEKYRKILSSYHSLEKSIEETKIECSQLKERVKVLQASNLKYKQKVEASQSDMRSRDTEISRLNEELHETVTAASKVKSRASNLDEQLQEANERVEAAYKLLQEYQDSYAAMYANAVGVRLNNIEVTASTSVSELQKLITGSSKSAIKASTDLPTDVDILDVDDLVTV